MNKSDLKDWTRDMLEFEIINMNAKNFQMQREINNLKESKSMLQTHIQKLELDIERLKNVKKENTKDDESLLDSILMLCYLSNLISFCPLEGHGYYYKYSEEKCKRQVHFTEGVGLHDGTGREVELR